MPHHAAPDPLNDLLAFIERSPTPYHAVESAVVRLGVAGFKPLEASASWEGLGAGRYYVKQGDSALVAFAVPMSRKPRGFRIVGAHTDSPNLRLKPAAEYVKEGYLQLGVEVYGGALLNSWLDRDLSIAGRVVLKAHGAGSGLETRLVRFEQPLCRVAQLAIHLDRDVNEKGLVLNRQEHLAPILGLVGSGKDASRPSLTTLVATELGTTVSAIVSMELMLYDVNPPAVGGIGGELVFAARLDNLAMSHAGVVAIVQGAAKVDERDLVPIVALFDHEEVGSGSAYGAEAPLLPTVIERIIDGTGGSRDDYHRAIARSLCVSADMSHAVHPNYADRSEPRHKVMLNGGPVVKVNSQQRYATCARTAALFEEICRREDVPVQHYAHRTDLPCGTTIGPVTATRLGIRTVDVGNAMLSMHSIRELAGTRDQERMVRVLAAFFGQDDPFAG
ncbi:MAG: M18 family aminopeptidase [Polyangiaceae bacterium]